MISPTVILIPWLVNRASYFVRFHVFQGAVLFVTPITTGVALGIISEIGVIPECILIAITASILLPLFFIALFIVIFGVSVGKKNALLIIGSWASKLAKKTSPKHN